MRSTKMWTAPFPIFMRARRPPCSCRARRRASSSSLTSSRQASCSAGSSAWARCVKTYGLQFGVQSFGYALFLTNNKATGLLNSQEGWQIGVGPSVVVMDQGMARSFTTATQLDDVYAFIFSQQGLMAGMGIQGSKITPYTPDD